MLCLLVVTSLFIAASPYSTAQSAASMTETDADVAWLILSQIRLPRVILGILVGGTLGLCGAALQGLLRNPLAEPGLIGVSGGAALGAALVFYFTLTTLGGLAVPLGGVIGALIALTVLYLLAGQNPSVSTLILAGIAINALSGALTSLTLNFAPNPYAALEILFWILGSLVDRSHEHVLTALPFIVIGAMFVTSTARALDALSLGEDTATSLGFDPKWIKVRIILGTGLAVGAAVSVSGMIGFIGLVVPHLIRPLIGYRPSLLLLPSALGGAALLTAADILVRLMSFEIEIKIGVITSLIGAPFFLYLILRTRGATT
jgi:iron complex transport system permease protein